LCLLHRSFQEGFNPGPKKDQAFRGIIEASGNETITLVLARGSYHPDKAEKPAAAAPKAAAAPVQAWKWPALFQGVIFWRLPATAGLPLGKAACFWVLPNFRGLS
jgi:hypothetical protein